jgi:hypothetical protein
MPRPAIYVLVVGVGADGCGWRSAAVAGGISALTRRSDVGWRQERCGHELSSPSDGVGLHRRGVGRELMAAAETRARKRGCHSAWLDTFSFQARGFYEKLGYEEFGRLDYPPAHHRHFMRKRLIPPK